jgi:hypothetical protein
MDRLRDENPFKQAYAHMQHAHGLLVEIAPPAELRLADWMEVDWTKIIEASKAITSSLQQAYDILTNDVDWIGKDDCFLEEPQSPSLPRFQETASPSD